MENKLTIEQLKNYLGTGLKIDPVYISQHRFSLDELDLSVLYNCRFAQIIPHCYRLSDLDKFIPELGFVPLKRLVNDKPEVDDTIEIEIKMGKIKSLSRFEVKASIDYESGESRKEHVISFFPYGSQGITPFDMMQQLFQWHFWVFGDEYFEQGLVIDKLKHGN